MYRKTKDHRYLEFAQKVADAYLSALPEDYISYWDFYTPGIPDVPKEAFAVYVIASTLL